jgi:hypothetical protein
MRIRILIAITLLTLAASAASADEVLCGDWENLIAEDMRILESDLTFERAESALETLRAYEPGHKATDMKLAYLNSSNILHGYGLRQVALALRTPEATKSFCEWLVKKGFWYD